MFEGPRFDVLAANYLQTVNYDVAPDPQRFLVTGNQAPAPHQLELVLNWFEDLSRLVPDERHEAARLSSHRTSFLPSHTVRSLARGSLITAVFASNTITARVRAS
jgi:hypothetical protein